MFSTKIWRRAGLAAAIIGVAAAGPAWAEDLTELTASEAAQRIKAGSLTSTALVEALLAKAEANSASNAFITLNKDGALAAARQADAAVKAGTATGALHGVPLVFKDNIHAAGLPNTAGTPALEGFVPKQSAPVVQALTDAGAIVLGKTNMHELAFGITSNNARFGAVGNAYDNAKTAGGSSGGTGSAVGARSAPAGLGTDTGGSVRIPSALNGVAGLRPTVGRYPKDGVTPISWTRDTPGPIARTVTDLVLLDGVITGDATTLAPASLKGLRIGVPRAYYYDNLDPATAQAVNAALAKMKAAGVELVEADLADVPDLNAKVGFPVALFEVMRDLPAYLARYDTGVTMQALADKIASPDVKGIITSTMGEGAIPAPVYEAAMTQFRPKMQQAYAEYFARNGVTAMVFPTTPLPARPIAGSDETVELNGERVPTFPTYIHNTDPDSNAGVPGLTIPVGLTADGLPVGLELDGPVWSDRRLLAVGLALEDLFGRLPPPAR